MASLLSTIQVEVFFVFFISEVITVCGKNH